MDRRTFLGWVGIGSIASSLPMAIAACSQQQGNGDGYKAVGTLQDLDKDGHILKQGLFASAVLVVRDPSNPESILAVNPKCTHEGCTVDWDRQKQRLICPCHDAQFQANGTVEKGPASTPLPSYSVRLEGSEILVQEA